MGQCTRLPASRTAWLLLRAAMKCFARFGFLMGKKFLLFRQVLTRARHLHYEAAPRFMERLIMKCWELISGNAKSPGAMSIRNGSFRFTRQRQLRPREWCSV